MRAVVLHCIVGLVSLASLQVVYGQAKPGNTVEDLNYYDDYELYTAGYNYDNYDSEGYDEGWYFDPETGSYDDVYGDYFFDDAEETEVYCGLSEDGRATFGNGTTPCDVKIEGVDAAAQLLKGGIDGVYKAFSCQGGRPMYKREGSAPEEERVLWYSSEYRDWDISNGSTPQKDDILMYGGVSGKESRPEQVQDGWNVAAEFLTDSVSLEQYVPVKASLLCADGSKVEIQKTTNFGHRPLLNDADMQNQYRVILQKPRRNKTAEVSLGLVGVLMLLGVSVVFGLPYLVARQRRLRRKPGVISTVMELTGNRSHKT